MKAVLTRRYGPAETVQVSDIATPVPGPGDVLVRIRAATVSSADMRMRSGTFPRGFGLLARLAIGFKGPRKPVLGTDLAGEVMGLGEGVTTFAVGDPVIAFVGAKLGCHAEYRVVKATGPISAKPKALDWPAAAALCFGGSTALFFLRDKARVQPGESVLVIGASGAVGSAAVQLAKAFGATVTGVTSTPNLAFVTAQGADDVIDYRATDPATLGRRWDVVADTTGTMTVARARRLLTPTGRLCLIAADLPQMLAAPFVRGIRVLIGVAPDKAEDLRFLSDLAEKGQFRPPVSRAFPLEQAVAAHALVESGRKVGSVVLIP